MSGSFFNFIRHRIKTANWKVVILLYHRVAELETDPQLLCVSPGNFAQHIKMMKQYARVVSLRELVAAIHQGTLPSRAIIITFDDGYADNYCDAMPILKYYDTPATFFVVTGRIGREREYWWDELDGLLLHRGVLPEKLELTIDGDTWCWDLQEAAHYGEQDYTRSRNWNVLEKDVPTRRQHIYRTLCQLLQPLPETKQQKVIDDLLNWAGLEPTYRATHRILTEKELKDLAHCHLAEIGAHAMSHTVLSRLKLDVQKGEVSKSKLKLEEIIGKPVNSFSYPFGTQSDYTDETVELVKEAGFNCACSNFEGVVHPNIDAFQLPRFLVRNWPREEFARRLAECFDG